MPKSDQGIFPNRYKVIPRTLIFVTRGEEILLLKGSPTKRLWANRYNGIGGHIERGEDVITAAERELEEETGLTTSGLWLCGTLIVDASDEVGIGIFILRGEYAGGTLIDSDEGLIEWKRLEDLAALPLVDDLSILLPRIMNLKRGDSPLAARSFYDMQDYLRVEFRS